MPIKEKIYKELNILLFSILILGSSPNPHGMHNTKYQITGDMI
jgi:hypothetical protein